MFGQLLMGIGLLFTGLMTMIDMASGFSDLPILTEILTKLSNPILGVLAGAIITVIVQSSAAAVGILQAISTTGFATYASTIPVILGQNIGTCLTSILSSIGASKNAKRTAAVHLYFNLIGTVIFMIFIYAYNSIIGFSFWDNAIDMGGIANFHLIFNIVSTIVLLPCIGILEKLTILTIRDKKKDNEEEEDRNYYLLSLNKLDQRITKFPSLAIANCLEVILKMGEVAEKNFRKTMKLLDKFDTKTLEHIQEREDVIDKMDVEIANFLVEIESLEIAEQENKNVTVLLKIESEFEKIGDYAYKLSKIIENMNESELKFSQSADKHLKIVYNIIEDILIKTLEIVKERNVEDVIEIEALREISEVYREKYKSEHIERLKNGKCSVETGISFLEVFSVYEKIIGHCVNISISALNYMTVEEYITKHEYINRMHTNSKEILEEKKRKYEEQYELLAKDNKLLEEV